MDSWTLSTALYFVLHVDSLESEVGVLDLIQVFLETFDKYF